MTTPRRALATIAPLLALCLVACPSPTGSTRKTLVLTGDPALDGAVTWAGASSYSLSFDGDSVAIGELAASDGVVRMLASFDLSSLPVGASILSAELRLYQNGSSSGDSYGKLDEVIVSNVDYDAGTSADALFGSRTTGYDIGIGPLAAAFVPNTWHALDVTDSAVAEVTERFTGRLQYRIQHKYENNHDGVPDTDGWTTGEGPANGPELVIIYEE